MSPMLFGTVIDTLNTFLQYAMHNGLMHRLTTRGATSSVSLFAEDAVVFCHPDPTELHVICELLATYGKASYLRTNFAKCLVTSIHCSTEMMDGIDCPLAHLPIKYLGLALCVRKASTSDPMPLVDKLLLKLATWRASMLNHGECLALVRHVLITMPTHNLPTILKRIMRIIQGFLC
ncbi:hypothetical protein D1007_46211 [Hordeum vulgare]|nr:hypothetical protein D1007_46211 [Hordeum vulgare]